MKLWSPRSALVLTLTLAAGCSGGGPTPAGPGATQPPRTPTGTALVRATLVIPARVAARSTGSRSRNYVAPSPSTKGLILRLDRMTSAGSTTLSTTGYDLSGTSPGSPCTSNATNTGATTCTIAIDAPLTSAASVDVFYLYSYNAVQTAGALPAGYTPAGALLSEDIGSGSGDDVPASAGPNSGGGIVAGTVNTPTFVLRPVVASPVASIGAVSATPLTLSAPGSGGATNALMVRGLDADGNPIASYLSGAGDDVYANPIAVSATASPAANGGTLSVPSAVTSATAAAFTATYTPPAAVLLAGGPPRFPTDTPPSATIALTASLTNGGYQNLDSLPATTANAQVAPLFAVADAATIAPTGFASNVYALQAALPTGASASSYTLVTAPAAADDCSAYPASFTQGTGATGFQRAVFPVASTAVPSPGSTCTLALSDTISTVTIVFHADGTHTP